MGGLRQGSLRDNNIPFQKSYGQLKYRVNSLRCGTSGFTPAREPATLAVMFQTVELPLWLLVLILGFAVVTFASHFLFPSVRWFFRRRLERGVERLN